MPLYYVFFNIKKWEKNVFSENDISESFATAEYMY